MYETHFNHYLKDLKKNIPQLIGHSKRSPIILINNQEYYECLQDLIQYLLQYFKLSSLDFPIIEYNFQKYQIFTQQKLAEHFQKPDKFCFLDLQCKDCDNLKVKQFRIIVELYSQINPKTCRNFMELAKGTSKNQKNQKLSYKSSHISRVQKDFFFQGGDINGQGGESIYGKYFLDENKHLSHDTPGKIGMAPFQGKINSSGSQFYITLQELQQLNGQYVIFGQVIHGLSYLQRLNKLQSKQSQIPKFQIEIVNCGEYRFDYQDYIYDLISINGRKNSSEIYSLTSHLGKNEQSAILTKNNSEFFDMVGSNLNIPEMQKTKEGFYTFKPNYQNHNSYRRNSNQQSKSKDKNDIFQMENELKSMVVSNSITLVKQSNVYSSNNMSFKLPVLKYNQPSQSQSLLAQQRKSNAYIGSQRNIGKQRLSRVQNNSKIAQISKNIIQTSALSSACEMKITQDSFFQNFMIKDVPVGHSFMHKELQRVLPDMGESLAYNQIHQQQQQELQNGYIFQNNKENFRQNENQPEKINQNPKAFIEISETESLGLNVQSQIEPQSRNNLQFSIASSNNNIGNIQNNKTQSFKDSNQQRGNRISPQEKI